MKEKYNQAIRDYYDAFHAYQDALRLRSNLEKELLQAGKSIEIAFKEWGKVEKRLAKARREYEVETLKEK